MKLSIRWIFDHLSSDWTTCSVDDLVARFNTMTAEIEHVDHITWSLDRFVMAEVVSASESDVMFHIPEFQFSGHMSRAAWGQLSDEGKYSGDRRGQNSDIHQPLTGYLLRADRPVVSPESAAQATYTRASLHDFGSDKDGLLPALACPHDTILGSWREFFETEDYILDIDNKSITHRPDMWGHRGFAREVGALMGLELKPEQQFLAFVPKVQTAESSCAQTFTIENKTFENCEAFGGLWLTDVSTSPSDLLMTSRFLKIGYRPINTLVDISNYVMADWGHPMHAFDADKIAGQKITIRQAAVGETLTLLDKSVKKLSAEDLVVADNEKVLGLAGIMGGKDDSLSAVTRNIFLEAGVFHAATIRRTALRHKMRTESSQRFEKTLDSEQVPAAICRFVALAQRLGVSYNCPEALMVVAKDRSPTVLCIAHETLINRTGIDFTPQQVVQILRSLSFEVALEVTPAPRRSLEQVTYVITVPSFRATKDVKIPEDIFEELARMYGFTNIEPVMPRLQPQGYSLKLVMLKRDVKKYLAYGARMREQQNYAYFNEQFLKLIGWNEPAVLQIVNPVSADNIRMVTSLIPGLLENCLNNSADYEKLSFFEWGRVWPSTEQESQSLAAVWFLRRGESNFYQLKGIVSDVARFFQTDLLWTKLAESDAPLWARASQGALISDARSGKKLGVLAQVQHPMTVAVGTLPEGSIWGFELILDLLLAHEYIVPKIGPLPKYPESSFDLSLMVPAVVTVADCEAILKYVDSLVRSVQLIDMFEKKEWAGARSLAFRVILGSDERSLLKEDIDAARHKAIAMLQSRGCELRA